MAVLDLGGAHDGVHQKRYAERGAGGDPEAREKAPGARPTSSNRFSHLPISATLGELAPFWGQRP